MEVAVLEASPVGACVPKEHPVVGRVLPKAECDCALHGGDVSARRGAFVAVLVCRIGVYAGDTVRHGVECGVWDGGAVAAL